MAVDLRAHRAVKQAIARGNLPMPRTLACADCDRPAGVYHHDSYEPERWLEVVALCVPCHKHRHFGQQIRKGPRYVSVRLPDPMYEEVRQLAEEEHRSVNGTIQEAIERYLRARRGRGQPSQPKDGQDAR